MKTDNRGDIRPHLGETVELPKPFLERIEFPWGLGEGWIPQVKEQYGKTCCIWINTAANLSWECGGGANHIGPCPMRGFNLIPLDMVYQQVIGVKKHNQAFIVERSVH